MENPESKNILIQGLLCENSSEAEKRLTKQAIDRCCKYANLESPTHQIARHLLANPKGRKLVKLCRYVQF